MTARDFLGNERIAELESKGYSPEYIKALAKEQYEAKKKELADSGVREDIAKMAIAQKLDADNAKKLNDEATASASDRFFRNAFDTSADEKAVDEADQRWRELNPDKIDIASRAGRLINRINPLTLGPKITGKAADIKQNGLTADSLDKDFAFFAGAGKLPNQFGRAVNTAGEWVSDKAGAEGAKQFFGENRKFFDDNVKELDRIIAENNKEWGMLGEALIDPLNVAPAGIFTKGAKVANIAKSAGTGFALGVGMNELRNAGDDKISTGQRLGDDLLSGLVMGGANALFSALSRGKANNISNLAEDLRGTSKAADGAEGAAKAADDAAALDDALDGLGGAQKEGTASASQELKAGDAAGGEQNAASAADDAASAPQGAQEIKAADGAQEIKSSPSPAAQGAQNAQAASRAQSNLEPREQIRQYLKTQNVADDAADKILSELDRGASRSAHLSESAFKKADELYERANRLEWAREYQSRVATRTSELAQMRADGIERFAAMQREAEKIAKENPTLSARAQRELLNSRIKPSEAELRYTRAYNDGADVDPIYAGQNFIWRVENDIKAHPYTTEQYGARLASKGFAPDVQAAAMQAYDDGDIKFLKDYIDAKVAKAEYDDIVNNQMKDWVIKDGKIRRAQNGKANAGGAAERGVDANGAGAGGKDERVSKGVSDLGDTPSRAERGPGGDAQVSSQRGSAAILGGEDAKNAAGDELVGRYGAASGDSAADAAASKQRVVSAQDAADQGGATLKSEPQGGDLAAKEGAVSAKQGAKLNEDMKKGFVNVNLTSHLAGGLSGGALNATDEEGKFSPERFAAGFIGGLGGVAVIRKGFRASMKAYAAKQAKAYPTLANDRPDLFAQTLSDEIKSRAKTTLFNAAEFAKTKVANKTGLDFEPQIFAGEKAYAELKYAPVRADKLSKAQAMAKEGKNELEIWRDTGWFRDKDGAWKFEIGDGSAKLNPKFQSGGKLEDLLKHDELFKAYPELRDVKVVKMQSDAPSGAMLAKELEKKYLLKDGQINRSAVAKEATPFIKKEYTFENFKADFPQGKAQTPIGEVNIGSFQFKKLQIKGREKYLGLIKPTLEKPSFIVDFEDTTFFFKAFKDEKGVVKFASVTKERNGVIDVTSNYPIAGRKFELLIREGKVRYTAQSSGDIKSLEHSLSGEEIISQNSKNGNNLGYFDPQSNTIALKNLKDRSTLMHEIQHWVQSKEGFATGGTRSDANYAKLHGEAEARNVQTRLGLDDAARAQKDPLSTFDVSPDDTIVLRDGGVNANEEPLKFRASEIENIGGEIKKRRPNIEQELEQSVEQIYKDSYKTHDTAGEVLDAVRTGNFDALSQGVQTNLSESQLARLKKDIAGAKLTHISRDGFTFKKKGKNGDEQMIFIDMDEGGRARINAYSKAHIDESIRANETMFDRLFGDDEALKNYSFETKAKFLSEKDPIKAEQILKKADKKRFAAQIASKSKQEQEKLQAEYARAARQADPFNPDMPTMNDLLGKTDALLGSYGGADGKWAQFVDTLWRKGINKYENTVDRIFEGENTPALVKKGMSVLDLRNAAKRQIDGAIESFFRESAAINAQARTAAKYLDKFDTAQSEQLFNALDGKIAKADLPEELQATYQKLRDAIDHNANELIKAGALKQENKLTDYIGHYYDEYMQNERGKISRTFDKFFARKDLSEAQRRALGLRTDISFVVANTLAKQRTQLLKARALEGIANRFGLDEIPAGARQGQYVRISDETVGGGIKKFGALGGKYVPKEVAEALKSTQALGGQLGALEKYWQPLIDHIKVNVTVKNPFTHVYNVASNAVLAFLHGDEKALASWALLGRQQRQEYWKLARRLGLDSAMDDLEGAIKGLKPKNDAEAFGIVGKAMDFLSTAGKNIYMSEGSALGRAARKAYAWEDEIFKIARFKKNLDAIAAKRGYAAGDLSKFSEKELAAAMSDAQYHYVDYSTHFNGFLRKSDKWGLMPFLHYSVKSTPMVIKAILKNPHRFAMMQAAFIAADAAGLSLSSIIADTEKENLTKPKWAQSSKFPNVFGLKAWARIGDSDTYFNAGRAAPGFRFDDVFEGGWGFVGGLVNIASGKSTLGYNITSEDDPKAVKVAKSVKEAAKNYLPTLTIGRYGQQLGEQALSDITGDKDYAPKDYNKDELGYAGILKRGVGARRFNQQKELNAELGKLRKQREELEYVKVPDSKDADKVEKAIKHNEKLEKMSASEKAKKQKQIDRKLEIFKEVADAEGFEFDVQSLKRLRDEKKQRKFAPKKFDPALISRPQIGKFSRQ